MHDELEQETGLDLMTKAELKAEARARGLSTTGTKAALLERVESHDGSGDAGGDGGGQEAAPAAEDRSAAEAPSGDGPGGHPEAEEGEGEPEAAEEGEGEPEAEAAEEGEGEPEAEAAEEGEGEPEAAEEGEGEPEAAEGGQGEPEPSRPRKGSSAADSRGDGARAGLADVASAAAQALTDLTGRTVDAVSGVRKTDDGYEVTIEVLELSRVPSTTDVLATYEVDVAPDGSVIEYSRAHRYYRNQTSRE